MSNAESCKLCSRDLMDGDVVKLTLKGVEGINKASVLRGYDIEVNVGDSVHVTCRKMYVNPRDIELKKRRANEMATDGDARRTSTRLSLDRTTSRINCLFCDTEVKLNDESKPVDGSWVKTHGFTQSIKDICTERADKWALQVKGRIEFFSDLHAADVVYHHACSVNFRTMKSIPKKYVAVQTGTSKRTKYGRPVDEDQELAFCLMCEYLEKNDDEQITMTELVDKMALYLTNPESTPYSVKHMKRKLLEKYGDAIYILGSGGTSDIVTMRELERFILRDFYKKSPYGASDESKKLWILESAARLLKSDIKRSVPSVTDEYPSLSRLNLESALEFLPASLRSFCDKLFVGKTKDRKVAAIGQAMVQAARPVAVIAPLQLGLGVQFHHHFRSKFAIDTLNAMGFSCSYGEVLLFEKNAAQYNSNILLREPMISDSNGSLLLVADNADHNSRTIDGKGSFHGMAMMGAFSPKCTIELGKLPRKKLSELNNKELTKVPLLDYRDTIRVANETKFCALSILAPPDHHYDNIWRLSVKFSRGTPNWSGSMIMCHGNKTHPGVSSIKFMPMLDAYSGSLSCLYSTMVYLTNISHKHGFPTILTFDQPLFFKASEIIENSPADSDLRQVVLLLGSFHTLMNVLGAIGYLMEGSGIREILCTVYGENAVDQILKGKAVQRAFRAHQLVDRSLYAQLIDLVCDDKPEAQQYLMDLEATYETSVAECVEFAPTDSLEKLQVLVNEKCDELSAVSKTAKLWISYLKLVQVARDLVAADRSGDWNAHLASVQACLPLFASAGHYNYLKSAYLYLQKMIALEQANPQVHDLFQRGLYVVRRTDKFWSGLGCDLAIEQCFMRALKSTGGLTRGSGIDENQRDVWTMSMPVLAEVNLSMQDFTAKKYETSEQHKDLTAARMTRDQADQAKVMEKLKTCSPLTVSEGGLCNVITGETASKEVNVQDWAEKGSEIISHLEGENIFLYSFSRKNKVLNLLSSRHVKLTPEKTIDPALMFQRFLVSVNNGDLTFEEVLKFELCTYPPALFESPSTMRKADKPPLARAILKYVDVPEITMKPRTDRRVVDVGSMLRRLSWTPGSEYQHIAKSIASFTLRTYGKAKAVFDGYQAGPSIKDSAHQRRQLGRTNKTVLVQPRGIFCGKRDDFLAFGPQKQQLIDLVIPEMNKLGIETVQARDDADVLIAKTAVVSSSNETTALIGEDTDLLVLCLYYSYVTNDPGQKELFFYSDKDKTSSRIVYNIHEMAKKLGSVCLYLPFLHAFTGCDCTSRIHGVGKETAFKKLCQDGSVLRDCAEIFSREGQNRDTIIAAGETAMCSLYDAREKDLSELRCKILRTKVVKAKSYVSPQMLPPTSSATKFHSLRTYYQVMTFMGKERGMDPLDWGFKEENGLLLPVTMDQNPAPQNLLKLVHCNCTTGCGTNRCACRRVGFECNTACGQCQYSNCTNVASAHVQSESDDDDDE